MPLFFYIFLFAFIILPALIIAEGWEMFSKLMNKKNWWWRIPYVLVVVLGIIVVILFLKGYR